VPDDESFGRCVIETYSTVLRRELPDPVPVPVDGSDPAEDFECSTRTVKSWASKPSPPHASVACLPRKDK
jgi:hypothetical protein